MRSSSGFRFAYAALIASVAMVLPAASFAGQITLAAQHAVAAGPICAKVAGLKAGAICSVKGGGHTSVGQVDDDGLVWWWTKGIEAGQKVTFEIAPAASSTHALKVEQTGSESIDVTIDGKLFTTLNFKKSEPRIYLYPVIGPTGVGVTRDFAMKDTSLERDNKRQDHPHHRSMWTGYGDVRVKDFNKKGYDFWAEPKGKKLPRQVLTKVVRMVSGPVFGKIEATIEWRSPEGQRLFSEDRAYTFYRGDENERLIDTKNVFSFNDMDVKFADTKEGGMIALRLAVTMDEVGVKSPEPMHGRATNSRGGVGAGPKGQCWGKPAEWCDYVGPLGGETVGVAVFDNPKNFRHPTTWHIRDYGLYTANPFGLAAFSGDKRNDGSKVWKKGESAEFNYRVIIHKGDTKSAHIAGQWLLYSSPPTISMK